MKYKDLNYKATNNQNNKGSILVKTVIGVVSLAIILLGLKLLVSPIVSAVAGFLQESSSSISFLIKPSEVQQDDGNTNFLLLGVDTRIEGGTTLTDTIIIASYNHSNQQISLISLPRDLWVEVPAFGDISNHHTKINGVYSLGEQFDYPEGGTALLSDVITSHLDIPIHYFVKVNFEAFKHFVDAVNGIDTYVENAFVDYQYPREGFENSPWSERWEMIIFDQGWQHMNGNTALKYARSRHALGPEGSDFSRAQRQQKVILALKDKIMSSETLFNPSRIKELYIAFEDEVETNIGLTDIPVLYRASQKISDFSDIRTYVLSNDPQQEGGLLYVPDASEFGGAFVLLPLGGWENIQLFIKSIVDGDENTLQVAPSPVPIQ